MSVNEKMTAIADAIREKTGDTAKLSLDGMAETIRKLPAPIVNTATGNPITLSDATDLKLLGLNLYGKTTQDSTPTPEAPAELVSAGDGGSFGITVAGKNLFSAEWEIGGINGDNGQNGEDTNNVRSGFVKVKPSTIYTISRTVSTGAASLRGYDKEKNYIGYGTAIITLIEGNSVTIPMNTGQKVCTVKTNENVHYLRFRDTSLDVTTLYQMEIGSTATAYEPYKGQTLPVSTPNGLPGIPVTSGGNYIDENGQQWVCDEVDFGRGVYVQRIKSALIDGSTGMGKSGAGDHFFFYQFNDGFVIDGEDGTRIGGYCSHYNHIATLYAPSLSNYEYQLSISAAPFNAMRFRDDRFTTLDEVKANLATNPMTLQYILATPIENALSDEELAAYATLHTNYPNTTILNDGGAGMEVSYVADTKLYIDNQVAALSAAIVST